MKPTGAEALKAAIRRALPLTALLVVLGLATTNAIKQLEGARYSASARIFLSTSDLGAILTGIQPSFVDPNRLMGNALSLARSPELFERASRRLSGGTLDGTGDLVWSTEVDGSGDSDVLVFTTTGDDEQLVIRTVNAVAAEYVEWREEISGSALRRAISQLRSELPRASPANRTILREQLNRLEVLETLHSGDAILIEQASGAVKVNPDPLRDSLLGASIGLVIALLISGVREALNTKVRSEADVEDLIHRPVLASVQTLPRRAGLVTVGRHTARFGEVYALLAANLMQIRGGDRQNILAVTSAVAGEGKTTTASNLAVALARRGLRVVLADFDARNPSLASFFKIPQGSPGVLQVIREHSTVESALWTIPLNGTAPAPLPVREPPERERGAFASSRTPDGSLRILTAGGLKLDGAIAHSATTPDLLDNLRATADFVILDTPPALLTAEIAELSRFLDGILIVVRHGKVTRRSLRSLARQARGWESEILGVVLTDSPEEEDQYYYYGSGR